MPDFRIERLLARDRWIVGTCLALITVLAWIWLWWEGTAMSGGAMAGMDMAGMDMAGMDMGDPTVVSPLNIGAYLASAFLMWFLMMIAMMLPSAAPMILIYARMARGSLAQGPMLAPTTVFAGMYVAIWAGFSLWAAAIQTVLVHSGVISAMGLALGDQRIGGAMLIAAGLYQVTPLKRACLASCRSPLSFLTRLWQPGWPGAVRLGLAHGTYCLGCCWLLMALLFVFGVMNLIWVAGLALVVLIEKVVPFGAQIGFVLGVLAVIVGAAMILGVRVWA